MTVTKTEDTVAVRAGDYEIVVSLDPQGHRVQVINMKTLKIERHMLLVTCTTT